MKEGRILVTGASGFLGRHVLERLRAAGTFDLATPDRKTCDLRDQAAVRKLLADVRPRAVLHLAAVVGGIQANLAEPGRFFYENAGMGIELIESARLAGVEKFLCVGSACAYPKSAPIPLREEDLWSGFPEDSNASYGVAKRVLLLQLQAYRRQYGMNGIYLLLANLYGPGDRFDEASSHVIPALIRRFVEARRKNLPSVAVWGSGNASREFLFVQDAADAIVLGLERYDGAEPVNLGTGEEVPIRGLAELIRSLTGFSGTIQWDRSKPDGQPRRSLDTSRAWKEFGWKARTPLEEGLRRTILWYERAFPHS